MLRYLVSGANVIPKRSYVGNAHSFITSKGKYHLTSTSQKAWCNFWRKILVNTKDGNIWTDIKGGWYISYYLKKKVPGLCIRDYQNYYNIETQARFLIPLIYK